MNKLVLVCFVVVAVALALQESEAGVVQLNSDLEQSDGLKKVKRSPQSAAKDAADVARETARVAAQKAKDIAKQAAQDADNVAKEAANSARETARKAKKSIQDSYNN